MKFNINKSNVLNAVSKNQLHKNRMRETWPDCNSHKKDQEVFIGLEFNMSQQSREGEGNVQRHPSVSAAALTLGDGGAGVGRC